MFRTWLRVVPVLLVCSMTAAAWPAAAQLDAEPDLRLSTNPFHAEGSTWSGDRTTGYVYVEYCYGRGGANPDGGEIEVALVQTNEAPDWVDVHLREEKLRIDPPLGPTVTPDCTDQVEFEVMIEAVGDVEWNATFPLTFDVVPSTEGDLGTFQAPARNDTAFSVVTGPDPDDGSVPPFDDDGVPPGPAPPLESDAPAPGIALVLLLGFLLAARRGSRRAGTP